MLFNFSDSSYFVGKLFAFTLVILFLSVSYANYSDAILISNSNHSISMQVAEYFNQTRNITYWFNVSMPNNSESISISQLNDTLLQPLKTYLNDNSINSTINYIILTKGIPLYTTEPDYFAAGYSASAASVDDEVALVNGQYEASIGAAGAVANPYYGQTARFNRSTYKIFLVSRLDGYNLQNITAMIDKAAQIAQSGLQSGTHVLNNFNGYKTTEFSNANSQLSNSGYSTIFNTSSTGTYPANLQNVSYFDTWGCYNFGGCNSNYYGNPNYTWVPGAFASARYSFSARTTTLAAHSVSYIADYISDGATGGLGYAVEPLESHTSNPQYLASSYIAGNSMGEILWSSMQYLSWSAVAFGDPKANYPSFTNATVYPLYPSNSSNLSCNISFNSSMFQYMNISYEWYKNGVNQSAFAGTYVNLAKNSLTAISTVNSTDTLPEETWHCRVYFNYGGALFGDANSSSAQISNDTLCGTVLPEGTTSLPSNAVCANSTLLALQNNTVLEGNGKVIYGDNSAGSLGINITGNNITVRNLQIMNVQTGMLAFNASNTTFENLTISLTSSICLNVSSTTGANFTNITFYNCTTALWISADSTNNLFYYNNFSSTGMWVNDSGTGNQFNTSVSGRGAGNFYHNLSSYDIGDSDGDYWGDTGTKYPLNQTNFGIALWKTTGADRGPGISTPTCGNFTYPNRVYSLQRNITYTGSITCLNITADNVTIRGNGFTVKGPYTGSGSSNYGTAIRSNASGLRVENISIGGASYGIDFYGATNATLYNITGSPANFRQLIQTNSQTSGTNATLIQLNTSWLWGGLSAAGQNELYQNITTHHQYSTITISGSNSILRHVFVPYIHSTAITSTGNYNQLYDIQVAGARYDCLYVSGIGTNISNSTFSNASTALDIDGSGHRVEGNTFANITAWQGVDFKATGTVFCNNNISMNSQYDSTNVGDSTYPAIFADNTNDGDNGFNTICNNTINNSFYGISLVGSSGNNITNNTIGTNVTYGIYAAYRSNNLTIAGNALSDTGGQGIFVTESNNSQIFNNSFSASSLLKSNMSFRIIPSVEAIGNTLYTLEDRMIRRINASTGDSERVIGTYSEQTDNTGTGIGPNVFIDWPWGSTTDGATYMYFVDSNKIFRLNTTSEEVEFLAGSTSGNIDGVGAAAKFSNIYDLEYSPEGMIYIVDGSGSRIRSLNLTTNGTAQVASSGSSFNYLAYGQDGYLYSTTNYSQISRINVSTGSIEIVAGSTAGATTYLEGIGTAARFSYPSDITFGPDGYLYIADTNSRRVRKINLTTNQTYLVAGSGTQGYVDGNGSSAQFNYPQYIAFDSQGYLYLTEDSFIRRINTTTNETTLYQGYFTTWLFHPSFYNYPVYLSFTDNVSIFNNTFSSPAANVKLDKYVTNGKVYFNSISGNSTWVENYGENNTFNTTENGVAKGNIYSAISSFSVLDADNNGWGDFGSQYPFNATTVPANWIGLGADWAPGLFTILPNVTPAPYDPPGNRGSASGGTSYEIPRQPYWQPAPPVLPAPDAPSTQSAETPATPPADAPEAFQISVPSEITVGQEIEAWIASASGAPASGATVQIFAPSGKQTTVMADADGIARFFATEAGEYSITSEGASARISALPAASVPDVPAGAIVDAAAKIPESAAENAQGVTYGFGIIAGIVALLALFAIYILFLRGGRK